MLDHRRPSRRSAPHRAFKSRAAPRRSLVSFSSFSCSRSLAVVAILTTAPAATADVVQLVDGRTLVGSVRVVGRFVVIETLDGPVRVPRSQVLRVRPETELRREIARLAAAVPTGLHGRLQLARLARDWGLHDEMWAFLDECLQLDEARQGAGARRLRALLAELEPQILPRKWRRASTRVRVRELLFRARRPRSPARLAAVVELLAREPGADSELRRQARAAGTPSQRIAALEAVARRSEHKGNDRFVYRTMILDGSRRVRKTAARLARTRLDPAAAVRYLAPALLHERPALRIRTAEAFAEMNEPRAIPLLAEAGVLAGSLPGGSTRAHIAILRQQAFLRDFDVQVAQASFIADPRVDTLTTGVVLDATVHAVVTYRTTILAAYRRALERLAGAEPPGDPRKWPGWWTDLAARRATRTDG